MTRLSLNLTNLATPLNAPWSNREYVERDDDPRGQYQRDRDRILHSDSFRKLQYKTQVFVVHEGDFFRTRLTHSLEVAQIGRTLASIFDLNEPLVEAICLAHDLGHSPFGHTGEEALGNCLKSDHLVWNANINSLTVIESSEVQYFNHPGLNLTWATREGIARHATNFDVPVEEGKYMAYRQPSLEAQAANIADLIAYCSHDVEDAIFANILFIGDLNTLGNPLWDICIHKAEKEFKSSRIPWQEKEKKHLLTKRIHRHLIDHLIRSVFHNSRQQVKSGNISTVDEMRGMESVLISFDSDVKAQVDTLIDYMVSHVYKSPIVDRQNYRANLIITRLFQALNEDNRLLPVSIQKRIGGGANQRVEIARFIASLTDKSATDLYAELFQPTERAMGHFIE
jgi:dGTPase